MISFTIVLLFSLLFIMTYLKEMASIFNQHTGKGSKVRYPPWITECPDYWSSDGLGGCKYHPNNGNPVCNNTGLSIMADYDSTSETPLNPNLSKLSFVEKCKWSNKCGINWEGISDKPCLPESFALY